MSCTEAEKSKNSSELTKLSTQEEESKSTVNQLMVQIQELQDKVNSPNDAKEFHDLETANSFIHVPSQQMSIPSARGLISRDSSLQASARNSFGISGNVFEDLPAPIEPPAVLDIQPKWHQHPANPCL